MTRPRIGRNAIARLVRGLVPVRTHGRRRIYAVADIVREMRRTDREDLDGLNPFELDAKSRALLRLDELRKRRGELVDATDVACGLAAVLLTVVRWAETSVDVLERDAELTARQATILERSLFRLREELYGELVAEPADDEPSDDDIEHGE